MKTIITSLAILISLSSYSQIENLGKWKIGTTVSYDMDLNSFSSLYSSSGIAPGGCYEPYPSPYTTRSRGYSAGVIGQYSIFDKLEVGVGAIYSKKYNNYGYPTDYLIAIYYVPNPSNFIEVPVFARYNFLKTKLNFHVESGVSTSYILDKSFYSSDSRFAMKAQAGIGMSYTFMNLLNVSATTFYKHRITDFSRKMNYSSPNSLSFELRTAIIF